MPVKTKQKRQPMLAIIHKCGQCGNQEKHTDKILNGHYLQVLLAVKNNALGLYFSVFNVHLVAAEDDGNVLTDTDQVTMPVGYVLIGDSRGDVKHDDGTLSCGGRVVGFK